MDYIKKNYKIIIPIVIITFLAFLSIIYGNDENEVLIEENYVMKDVIEENIKEQETVTVIKYFDIKGEVNLPGVYPIEDNMRIIDAVLKAGGFKDNSDTSLINLSKKITDEMVIIIHSKDDIKENKNVNCKSEIECGDIGDEIDFNDEAFNNYDDSNKLISINNATLDELMTLPKIGEVKAKEIIKYRNENNGFKDINELLNISGIGSATFELLKELITI